MTFTEFPYHRPDLKQIESEHTLLLEKLKNADSAESAALLIKEIYTLQNGFSSMAQICGIRHSINTTDTFYKSEQEYFDTHSPLFENLIHNYYTTLLNSNFKNELEKIFGKQLFRLATLSLKIFSPAIIEDLVKENTLGTKYQQLMASASILFEGKERNLSELAPFMRSTDRTIRKNASEARWGFLKDNADTLDSIFDDMVKIRTVIATKLGYKNFVQLGYDRMLRTDYNASMVEEYRKAVQQFVVPIATMLRREQEERLGIDTLMYYDEALVFESGNAKPKGDAQWILKNGQQMYAELGEATNTFMQFMVNHQLLDLVAKKGKAGGGYCTYIANHKAPFIFSNFNGTAADIDVLTHEVGHAFQVFSCRDLEVNEYHWPTSDAAEIHSMSMEYFTYPWMDLFFEEQADKYRYAHLADAVLFLPYGVSVDEFQHVVYSNPELSPVERKKAWSAIEKKYLPLRKYENNEFLETGGWWQTQAHIFQSPFYYIDYTLAQICAFQFWEKARTNHENAFADYLQLCKAGGSKSFLELVELANLKSPFEPGVMEEVMQDVTQWLKTVNAEIYNVPA
ncbi:MAG TPA: M3 family oligoendopeptidase [Chitinophagales bacterium]|nr:M3 family oligoendopeptidase [Chitinophagales bacterium]